LLSLPAAARQWLPPLPHAPSSEAYVHKVQRNMRQAAAGMEALRQEQQQQQGRGSTALSGTAAATQQEQPALQQEQDSAGCPYIGVTVSSNFLAAQSLWDATMAYAISQALQQQPAGQQQQQHQQESGLLDLASPQQPVTPTLGHHTAAQATAGAVSAQPAGGNTTAMPAPATDAAPASLLQQHQHQHQRQQLEGVGGSSATQLPPGPLVVHVCGKFHCEDRLGIPEHLAAYAPGARVLVVVFSPADSMEAPRDGAVVGSADFVVLTDSKLPRSFEVEHPV
jgi:hypothetical protein